MTQGELGVLMSGDATGNQLTKVLCSTSFLAVAPPRLVLVGKLIRCGCVCVWLLITFYSRYCHHVARVEKLQGVEKHYFASQEHLMRALSLSQMSRQNARSSFNSAFFSVTFDF